MKKMIVLLLCIIFFIGYINILEKNKEPLIPIDNISIVKDNTEKIVYFGRPTCPFCNKLKPTLIEVLKEEHKQIYYFNTDDWRDNKEFDNILKKYKVDSIPYLVYIKSDGSFKEQKILDEDYENKDIIKSKVKDFLKNIN